MVVAMACGADRNRGGRHFGLRIPAQAAPSPRTDQPHRVGERTTATTRLENLGTRTLRGWAKDGWQPTAGATNALQKVQVNGRGSTELHIELAPERRGELTSEHLTIRSLGPLGLAGRQVVHRVPHTVQVLPEFASRKHLPSRLAPARAGRCYRCATARGGNGVRFAPRLCARR